MMPKKSKNPLILSFLIHFLILGGLWTMIRSSSLPSVGTSQKFENISLADRIQKAFHSGRKTVENAPLPVSENSLNPSPTGGAIDEGNEPNPSEVNRYFQEVMARINRTKKYPEEARLNEQEGVVEVAMEISGDGAILKVELVKNDRVESLNQATLKAVKSLGQLPPPPHHRPLRAVIPVHYLLNSF